jgi:hypothetical protein
VPAERSMTPRRMPGYAGAGRATGVSAPVGGAGRPSTFDVVFNVPSRVYATRPAVR